MSDCNTITRPPTNRPSPEDIDRMLRTATFGLHMFDNTTSSVSDDRRASGDSSVAEMQIMSPPEQTPRRQVRVSLAADVTLVKYIFS